MSAAERAAEAERRRWKELHDADRALARALDTDDEDVVEQAEANYDAAMAAWSEAAKAKTMEGA